MRNTHLIVCLTLLVSVAIITYSNHFRNAFQFDDIHTVVENDHIRDINNIPLFFKDGTTSSTLPANQAYRPVVVSSLALDYFIGNGYNLFYFHLSTFVLFVFQGLLMFFLYKKVLQHYPNKKLVICTSLIAAAWYLLHPAIAETVNYISARSDVLSTLFLVLAFVLYTHSSFCRKYFIYLIPVCIGTLAKPTTVMFAPMLLFYLLFFEHQVSIPGLPAKQHRSQVLTSFKQSIPSFITCVFMYVLIDKLTPETWIPGGASASKYLITQPYVILHYFATFFAPINLSADTDWTVLNSIWDIRFFIGVTFISGLLFIAFICSKKTALRPISFGIIWFLLALLPSSSIIPLGEVMNDHRMYFPFIGLAIAITWSLALLINLITKTAFKQRQQITFFIVIGIVATLSIYTYGTSQRNKVWHTPESLWKDVTLKSPGNGRGLMNYGLTLMEKADYAGAVHYFEKTLQKSPHYPYVHINMGIAKEQLGNLSEAETFFNNAIRFGPAIPEAYAFYARFLLNNQRSSEAAILVDKGLAISPKHAKLLSLRNSLNDTDQTTYSAQLTQLLNLLSHTPTAENYINLSLLYYKMQEYQNCINAAETALKYKPGYDLAYNNICAAYNKLGYWDKAIAAGEQGLTFNPNNQLLRNNLAESKRGKAASR
jgi:Tfp pilus assembly protein PilF